MLVNRQTLRGRFILYLVSLRIVHLLAPRIVAYQVRVGNNMVDYFEVARVG